MANKQTLPVVALEGVKALKEINVRGYSPVNFEKQTNSALEFARKGVAAAEGYLNLKNKLDDEALRTETASVLKQYRTRLGNAVNEEEFNTIVEEAESDLNTRFADRLSGSDFWAKNGEKILTANKQDVEVLRQMKMADFGKQSLNGMLAGNQNLLAYSEGTSGEKLLSRGVEEIEKTPFLSAEEKEKYRDGYLQTGILNLALHDPQGAAVMADKFLPSASDTLKAKINEAETLRLSFEKSEEERRLREEGIQLCNKAFSLWKAKEEGQISPAEFYVLSAENDAEMLWGEREQRSATPLADAYRIVKKINGGEKLSVEEIRDAGNSFISAYRQKKIGLDEVEALHNQLMLSQGDKAVSGMLFDEDVDHLADKVLLPDLSVAGRGVYAEDFMEKKAKLAFDIYENYYSKKTALADEFIAGGGTVTPALEKRFRRQALAETREEMGLKENTAGELNFSDLRRLLKSVYTGQNEQDVWRRFYEKAPYAEDKKALFRQIAFEEQRRELSYPQFDNLADLDAADLQAGERFYFKGRLAVKV